MSDFESVPKGAASVQELAAWGGGKAAVYRDARGRFLRGTEIWRTRDPATLGRSIVNPESALRRALGLPSHKRRPK